MKKHQAASPASRQEPAMNARGMTVRDIQAHLSGMHGTAISPTLISTVSDALGEFGKNWGGHSPMLLSRGTRPGSASSVLVSGHEVRKVERDRGGGTSRCAILRLPGQPLLRVADSEVDQLECRFLVCEEVTRNLTLNQFAMMFEGRLARVISRRLHRRSDWATPS